MDKQFFTLGVVQVLYAINSVPQAPALVNVVITDKNDGPVTHKKVESLSQAAANMLTQMLEQDIQVAGATIVNLIKLGEMTMEEYLGQPVAQSVEDFTSQLQ